MPAQKTVCFGCVCSCCSRSHFHDSAKSKQTRCTPLQAYIPHQTRDASSFSRHAYCSWTWVRIGRSFQLCSLALRMSGDTIEKRVNLMNLTSMYFLEFSSQLRHSSPQNDHQDFKASLAVPLLAVEVAEGGRGEPGIIVAAPNDLRKWVHTIAIQTPRTSTSCKIVPRRKI